ncbi:MAG: hypothetical protein NTX58_03145 [Actinobacteria bacterium]|nr:hypothetical protein [Actinomycetota bacterium]
MKRIGALILAVGMIFGSLALRNSLDNSTQAQTAIGGDSSFRLTCAVELADVCTALAATQPNLIVMPEEAGATADRLTQLPDGTDPGFDAWLTVGPWAEIVQDNRSFTDNTDVILGEASRVLGSSPAQIVTSKSGQKELGAACGGTITWKCLGENQSLPQPQSIGMASPSTGAGLAVLADATNSFFGNNSYSATNFEDAAFIGWFDQLTKKSRNFALGEQTVLERAVAAAGTFTTVGALSTEVESLKTTSSKFNSVPAPKDAPDQPVIAQVRLVPATGITAQDALDLVNSDALTQLLKDSNWNTSDQDSPSNMPAAGVLQVLRDMWDA